MSKNYFNRYIWLVDLIYRHGHITMEEINRCWSRSALNEMKENCIPRRTFFNHRDSIEEIFGIRIKCDRTLGYYIENPDDVMDSQLKKSMLQSLSLQNLVQESSGLRNRIVMEDIPSSGKWLADIIHAMKEGMVMEMTYQSFYSEKAYTFDIEPYCLKMFRQRWYVLARSVAYDQLRMYSLDRIQDLALTSRSFSLPEDFDAQGYFSNFYGASVNDEWDMADIRIKVDSYQANYLRTLPLHHSQTEVERSDEFSVFSFRLVPTFEFERELLALGEHARILEPQWFRERMAAEISNMYGYYSQPVL